MVTSFNDPEFERFILELDESLQSDCIVNNRKLHSSFEPMNMLLVFKPNSDALFWSEDEPYDGTNMKQISPSNILSLRCVEVQAECTICQCLLTDGYVVPVTFRTTDDVEALASVFQITGDGSPTSPHVIGKPFAFTLKADYISASQTLIFSRNDIVLPALRALDVYPCTGELQLAEETKAMYIQSIQVVKSQQIGDKQYLVVKINEEEPNCMVEPDTILKWLDGIYPEGVVGNFGHEIDNSKNALRLFSDNVQAIRRSKVTEDDNKTDFTILKACKPSSRILSHSCCKPFVFSEAKLQDVRLSQTVVDTQKKLLLNSTIRSAAIPSEHIVVEQLEDIKAVASDVKAAFTSLENFFRKKAEGISIQDFIQKFGGGIHLPLCFCTPDVIEAGAQDLTNVMQKLICMAFWPHKDKSPDTLLDMEDVGLTETFNKTVTTLDQFFERKGKALFLNARRNLREIVQLLRRNTWDTENMERLASLFVRIERYYSVALLKDKDGEQLGEQAQAKVETYKEKLKHGPARDTQGRRLRRSKVQLLESDKPLIGSMV